MDESEVRDWFAGYLSTFAALGRGESRPGEVVLYYGVPFLLTTDDVSISLGTTDQVVGWLQTQVDGMAAANYDHTEILASEVTIVNRNTALHRAEFSRQRADGSEINQMSVTYVITRESEGLRVSALLLHSA